MVAIVLLLPFLVKTCCTCNRSLRHNARDYVLIATHKPLYCYTFDSFATLGECCNNSNCNHYGCGNRINCNVLGVISDTYCDTLVK
jgi:hypothetical protein